MTHQAIRFVVPAWLARGAGAMLLALAAGSALAQGNAIESITANQQGSNVVINVAMRAAPAKAPIGFSITNPPTPPARAPRRSTWATCAA